MLDVVDVVVLFFIVFIVWELLFECMFLCFDDCYYVGQYLLVIGGVGGVGLIVIQLVWYVGFMVIVIVFCDVMCVWCMQMGVDYVIDYCQLLLLQFWVLGIDQVEVVLNLVDIDYYWDVIGDLLVLQGYVGLIVELCGVLCIGDLYKVKCIGIYWEFMFVWVCFCIYDMIEQYCIFNCVVSLVDVGELCSIVYMLLGLINVVNLCEVYCCFEVGEVIGKLVLFGWD